MKTQKNRKPDVGRIMVKIMRHTAIKLGLSMSKDGSVCLSDLLALPIMHGFSHNQVVQAVKTCSKRRLCLYSDKDGKEYIKANQGHTIKHVESDASLKRVTNPEMIGSCLVHGTTSKAWLEIFKSGGLNRMKRNHIHIAMGLPGAAGVISGMRNSSDVHIFLDGKKMLENEVKLYKSANNVILCEGNSKGCLSKEYFLRVVTSDGKVLFKS